MDFKNKTFIVTGGSSGIGKATALMLLEKGANVAITGRNAEKVATVAEEIGALGIAADVSTQAGIDATMKQTLDAFGGLHGLINNAGHGWMKSMLEVTWEDFEDTYRVNVFGAAMMAQAAAKVFVEQNYGNIVNIASTAATRGFPAGSVYSSSKFALRGMTQCWQGELRKHNIRVMGVNPSEVTTAFGKADREERAEHDNKLRGEEIAHAIVSALAMDDRGYIPEITIHATNPF
ncbi:MAG: SDR family NAD(P)-dependent oxidoreductase [Salibacteraceae bacterium]|nr:SDR family NAD(P)-dependent oxidoreductase [Salibacteraceae bacterium]